MEPEVIREKKFVGVILPWLVAAGGLALYLGTLNRWVSFTSLGPVARTSGWLWQPELYAPLHWLVTYPFRWLPARAIPLALNVFSALCAAMTLGLLARSVTLLPHDRTNEQRLKERHPLARLSIPAAWAPPVLAALVCGLQLTFWEYATAASGGSLPLASNESFDLLLFAYVIRNVLEFRIDQKESWLIRASFVYGAAMTDNWAMIGFFPLFLTALVWIRGLNFFNAHFLTRMSLWGLAGVLLYLVLPLAQSRADIAPIPFWQGLKANLGGQEYWLATLFNFFKVFKQEAFVLAMTSLVPLLWMSIRWASDFGDTSKLGAGLATLISHLMSGLFLVLCIYVAMDPPFSARNQGVGIPFLTLSYLGALSVGYFSGYFLLVFGGKPATTWPRTPGYVRLLRLGVVGAVWLLVAVTASVLIERNLPQVRITNGPMVKQYAGLLAEGLPPQGAVVLSDDARRLMLMEAAAARRGQSGKYVFLDTGSLKWPDYHRFLRKKYPHRWPTDPPRDRHDPFDSSIMLGTVLSLAQTNSLFYLHPSFGYYFELMYAEPHGLVYKLKAYPTNTLIAPLLPKEVMAENEAFWAKADAETLRPLVATIAPPRKHSEDVDPGLVDSFMTKARLKPLQNRDAFLLGAFYSRGLNDWGVEMQRNGHLAEARAHFERAQDLNRDNLVAKVNLECNQRLQAGRTSFVPMSKSAEEEFGAYRGWDDVMGQNGPFDEPRFCYQQGRLYVRNGLYHQAAHQFDRVKTLAPDYLAARLWLAQLHVMSQLPDQALKLVEEIHADPDRLPVPRTNRNELLLIETSAHLARNDLKGAEATVETALAEYPTDADLLATATQVYMNYGRYSNALVLVDRQLQRAPGDPGLLATKGYACIQLGSFTQAIPPLTQCLALGTNIAAETHDTAQRNRAIAYLKSDQLDPAQSDYEELQKKYPTDCRLYYGLQEIAYRKKETNACLRNCNLYLANARTNTAEARIVMERRKGLMSAAAEKTKEENAKGSGKTTE